MYYKGRKGGDRMTTSTNKMKTEEFQTTSEKESISPKLVVDNSTSIVEESKEPITREVKAKSTSEKKIDAKANKIKKEPIQRVKRKRSSTNSATTTKKTSVKKTPSSKKASVKTSLVLQYQSIEVNTETLIAKVKDMWITTHNNSENEIKNIDLYIKPEEYSAYYVINNSVKGRIDL